MSCVRRIGQQQLQTKSLFVNLAFIVLLMENTEQMQQFAILYCMRDLWTAASEDIALNAEDVFDTCIGKSFPQELQSAVMGQYNDVIIDVS